MEKLLENHYLCQLSIFPRLWLKCLVFILEAFTVKCF